MFLGWDDATWNRMYRWAESVGLKVSYDLDNISDYTSKHFDLKCEWIKRGGPITGPQLEMIHVKQP